MSVDIFNAASPCATAQAAIWLRLLPSVRASAPLLLAAANAALERAP
jgi:hypothetical protein